jgi:hypothetical protein
MEMREHVFLVDLSSAQKKTPQNIEVGRLINLVERTGLRPHLPLAVSLLIRPNENLKLNQTIKLRCL